MSNKYLPSESWKYKQSLYSSFNNELLGGLSQGLNFYDPQKDLTLYQKTDYKPLDKVNFDDINKKIDENDDIYNNISSGVSGGLDGILKGAGKGLNSFFTELLGLTDIKIYAGLAILFFILNRK